MYIIFLVGLLVGMDQISKYLVTSHLYGKEPLTIIPNFLEFYYLENKGAAFGILQEKRTLFIIITIIVVLFIVYLLYHYEHNNPFLYTSLIFILAGTIGNFIDRVRLHYVVDFIKVKIFGYNFAIFNVADSFIVVGTIILIIYILLAEEKGKINREPKENNHR